MRKFIYHLYLSLNRDKYKETYSFIYSGKKTMKFAELGVEPKLARAVEELGFEDPTEIQRETIPSALKGRDVIAHSATGSGKTAAFGLPILQNLRYIGNIEALILVPTRELCNQVASELKKFSRYQRAFIAMVYGGVSMNNQVHELRKANIVVSTPGRMLDHLRHKSVNLSKVRFVILDEADKMFEMGFVDDVRSILQHTPKMKQTMLFSATIDKKVRELARHYMNDPVNAKAEVYLAHDQIKQVYYCVQNNQKFSLLAHFLKGHPHKSIVFCGTRLSVDFVSRSLFRAGLRVSAIHGGLSQNKRNHVISDFHAGKIQVLVATDVAARGLDIKDVEHIYNFDIPKTSFEYLHRIGRTARAGKHGSATSLLSERDHDNFRNVLSDRTLNIERGVLPEFERIHVQRMEQRRGFKRHGFGQRQQGRGGFGGSQHGERRKRHHGNRRF